MISMTCQGTPIPLLDLKAQYATIRAEIWAALDRVIESQRFILGPEVEVLEQDGAADARRLAVLVVGDRCAGLGGLDRDLHAMPPGARWVAWIRCIESR